MLTYQFFQEVFTTVAQECDRSQEVLRTIQEAGTTPRVQVKILDRVQGLGHNGIQSPGTQESVENPVVKLQQLVGIHAASGCGVNFEKHYVKVFGDSPSVYYNPWLSEVGQGFPVDPSKMMRSEFQPQQGRRRRISTIVQEF